MRRSITTVVLPVVCTLSVLLSGQAAVAADPADAFWSDAYYNAGIQGTVKAMVSQPGALYVGGSFTSIGQLPVANVARLNTTDGVVTSTTALGEGLPGWVYALGLHDGDVVVGCTPAATAGTANHGATPCRPMAPSPVWLSRTACCMSAAVSPWRGPIQ